MQSVWLNTFKEINWIGRDMDRYEAIKLVKQAIVVCDISDMPDTKISLCDILEALTTDEVKDNFSKAKLH